ncbi:MAG: hypothetical protein ACE5GB_11855, partial [Acidimicrobiales bacterium]
MDRIQQVVLPIESYPADQHVLFVSGQPPVLSDVVAVGLLAHLGAHIARKVAVVVDVYLLSLRHASLTGVEDRLAQSHRGRYDLHAL